MTPNTRYKISIALGAILGFLFLFSIVNAETQWFITAQNYNNNVWTDDNTCANTTQSNIDSAGFSYLKLVNNFYTEFNCTNPTQTDVSNVGSREDGYNWWAFSERDSNNFITIRLFYKNINGTTFDYPLELNTPLQVTEFTDNSGIASHKLGGVPSSTIPTGDWAISTVDTGFWSPMDFVYAIVYTDDDLSNIDTLTELYNYMDILNGTGGGGGNTDPVDSEPSLYSATILDPTYGTTTASTTFDISINFAAIASFDPIPAGQYGYHIRDALTNEIEQVSTTSFLDNTAFNVTIDETITSVAGSKIIRAFIQDTNGVNLATFDEVFFNVATNTFKAATGLDNPNEAGANLTQINCDLFDVGCQFQKAITFLFYPNQNSLDKFGNIWQRLTNVVPFGYVTVTINQLKALDDNAQPAFEWPDIPFVDTVFDPMRTAISGIMWALFGIYFFMHRLRHLDL